MTLTKDRPVLSLERAPHKDKTVTVKLINIWSWSPDGTRHQDWLTDRQSQCDFDFDLSLYSRERERVCRQSAESCTSSWHS
jgi:hypothetical protein